MTDKVKLRAALDQIDTWLQDPDLGFGLSRVLAAVRGPDSSDEQLKHRTTSYVREAAFPKTFRGESIRVGWDFLKDPKSQADLAFEHMDHFHDHVRSALISLDLVVFNGSSWEWKS